MALDQDVALLYQPSEKLLPLRPLKIQGDTLLVGVEMQKQAAFFYVRRIARELAV